ncbi:MAG: putative hemolysin [Verrucomicrobiales bacterium]|jgi:putative hemolysin
MKLIDLAELSPRIGSTWIGKMAERLLGIDQLNRTYSFARSAADPEEFFARCIEELEVVDEIEGDIEFSGLVHGPAIVVANHPFGGLESIVLARELLRRRSDTKLMGNFLLMRIEPLRDCVIAVDPFGGKNAARMNVRPMREAIRHIQSGGVLMVFPAGEVSHFRVRDRAVTDPPWSSHVAAMVRKTGAPVIPVHTHGRNSSLFQFAGFAHPRLRTLLLPRELARKRGETIRLTVGRPLAGRQLQRFPDIERMTAFIRAATYFLKHSAVPQARRSADRRCPDPAALEPVAPAAPASQIAAEILALPADCQLLAQHGCEVYVVRKSQAPKVVEEIGRLRELTFREIGEGTGNSRDLDSFDDYYEHLFLWSPASLDIVGAYRLVRVDEAVKERGSAGLYTATLFNFRPGFVQRLDHAIELGRSFVVARHQKQRHSLMLLWCGICAYIDRNQGYHTLFGPVSMSQDYTSVSRQLLVWFIRKSFRHPVLSRLVQATRPFKNDRALEGERDTISTCLHSIDDVSALISELEADGKGVPVLFRQYLRMNALLIGFNVDEAFSSVLDGLLLADLRTADPKLLRRYFGADALDRFMALHGMVAELPAHRD